MSANAIALRRPLCGERVFFAAFLLILFIAFPAYSQKATSIVIHDTSAGGEGATSTLRNEIKSALERERPCVEPFGDQDIRDAIEDDANGRFSTTKL